MTLAHETHCLVEYSYRRVIAHYSTELQRIQRGTCYCSGDGTFFAKDEELEYPCRREEGTVVVVVVVVSFIVVLDN